MVAREFRSGRFVLEALTRITSTARDRPRKLEGFLVLVIGDPLRHSLRIDDGGGELPDGGGLHVDVTSRLAPPAGVARRASGRRALQVSLKRVERNLPGVGFVIVSVQQDQGAPAVGGVEETTRDVAIRRRANLEHIAVKRRVVVIYIPVDSRLLPRAQSLSKVRRVRRRLESALHRIPQVRLVPSGLHVRPILIHHAQVPRLPPDRVHLARSRQGRGSVVFHRGRLRLRKLEIDARARCSWASSLPTFASHPRSRIRLVPSLPRPQIPSDLPAGRSLRSMHACNVLTYPGSKPACVVVILAGGGGEEGLSLLALLSSRMSSELSRDFRFTRNQTRTFCQRGKFYVMDPESYSSARLCLAPVWCWRRNDQFTFDDYTSRYTSFVEVQDDHEPLAGRWATELVFVSYS
ncbi:hypothetical protein MARPO_0066s0061 [Marchantia polymorpha]|uniref:Uncharacterized protein n=1 Tax=Marchantia polymorpha TaxID=3197 RepID=A0A2R6WQL1_MARPO|nr:hypothetical protein MARPO_0066s0061 [Marchantia polymorpha]|eukprot:PTQ36104.1 hypothetical protein MARPO_0066s0061 [Marchantia polymorpha]